MISRWRLHLEQSERKSITKKRRNYCCKVLFWRNATNAVSKRQNIWPCKDTRESSILCLSKSAQIVNTRIFTQTELGSITNKFTREWKGQNWVEIVDGSGVNILEQKKCAELHEHSLFMCEECKMTFTRSDGLKFHKDKIHLGLIFKCKYCDTYSTARKDSLERHILIKHSDEDRKENESRSKKPRSCTEEGYTYVDLYGSLKRHIQGEHEGIIFKCHIENCNFETSWTKNLKTHIKTHR